MLILAVFCWYFAFNNQVRLLDTVLQAAGPITHPWLDQFKQVNGSEKVHTTSHLAPWFMILPYLVTFLQLMSWTRHSSLVEVVEESLSAVSPFFLHIHCVLLQTMTIATNSLF